MSELLIFLRTHPNEFFKGRELCMMFDYPLSNDRRALRLAIEELRRNGAPIIYNNHDGKKGYAWATDGRLIARCRNDLMSKIVSLRRDVDRLDGVAFKAGVL